MLAQDRCSALRTLITNVANAISNSPTSGTQDADSKQSTTNMLRRLEAFAGELVTFFDRGLATPGSTGSGGYTLTMENSTREWVFGLIADQMSFDLDAIVRAYTQRSAALGDSVLAGKLGRISISDALAYSILEPAIEAGLFPNDPPTVFTYFQKSLRIRIIPYAPVAFVGVPYTAIHSASEYVALAHEIGHFVYHQLDLAPASNPVNAMSRSKSSPLPWYRDWIEEIAADVYGCVIVGPYIARSFMDLSLEATKPGLVFDDGRHPVPLLRPYMYTETLRSLQAAGYGGSNDLEVLAGQLDAAWKATVAGLGIDVDLALIPIRQPAATANTTPNATPITIDRSLTDMRNELRTNVIDVLVGSALKGVHNVIAQHATSPGFYSFQTLWQSPSAWQANPQAITGGDLSNVVWTSPPALGPSSLPPTYLTDLMRNCQVQGAVTAESSWIEILEFGGWIDQGPAGGVPHK